MKPRRDRATGQLAAVFRSAMQTCARLTADGWSRADREDFIAKALRAAWPSARAEPWHFLCDRCDDAGWLHRTCVDRSCGRPFTLPAQRQDEWTGRGHCTPGHTYVVPCSCLNGTHLREGLFGTPVIETVRTPTPVRQTTFRKFGRR